jgi:hypothetical protein
MSSTARGCLTSTLVAALVGVSQLIPVIALADNSTPQQHNVTYRARIDGVSRGATITYNISDTEVDTANPTMLPGQNFEANTVLSDPKHAGMEISIRWPYTATLHCEILVDDEITAQADDFIAPRLLPQSNDPGYGVMPCGAQLANAAAISAANTPPVNAPANQPRPTEAPPPAG